VKENRGENNNNDYRKINFSFDCLFSLNKNTSICVLLVQLEKTHLIIKDKYDSIESTGIFFQPQDYDDPFILRKNLNKKKLLAQLRRSDYEKKCYVNIALRIFKIKTATNKKALRYLSSIQLNQQEILCLTKCTHSYTKQFFIILLLFTFKY